jgi:hypothetical protein
LTASKATVRLSTNFPQERRRVHLEHSSSIVNNPHAESENGAIPRLVGQIYDSAPVAEKIHLLEHLLQPLGALSMVAIANGAFARIWLRSPGETPLVRPEDVRMALGGDVAALVAYVQQFSVQTVCGLTQIVSASPALAGSAVAALLVTALLKRARGQNPS